MTIPKDNLRLFLTFLDELKQVKILAAAAPDHFGSQLYTMGAVEGKAQLLALLETAEIDNYIIVSGDPFTSRNSSVTAYELSPERIVNSLEEMFQRADELDMKILEGEKLTEEERSFRPPTSLHVCSSTLKTDDGLKRIKAWFNPTVSKPASAY
jgi:hypothetical protein